MPIYLTLNQNVYGVFGTLVTVSDKRQVPIKKAELRADELTFEVHDNADRLVTFRLKMSDTKMTGEASVQGEVSKVSLSLPGRGGGLALAGFVQNARGGGRGVSAAPMLVYKEEPDYTEEARAAKLQARPRGTAGGFALASSTTRSR